MDKEKPSRKISRDSIQFGIFLSVLSIPVYFYTRDELVSSFFIVIGVIWLLAGYMGRYLADGGSINDSGDRED